MRLRYLHFPRCGPLTDTAVIFGREDLIAKVLDLPRKGSLNFVVGVNGSGKSSLLRALYRTFRAVKRREWPELPVTLAWDRTLGDEILTALFHYTNLKDTRSFFATFNPVSGSAQRMDWEMITSALSKGAHHPLVENLEITIGPNAITNPRLFAHLPNRLIAYSSGADDPWLQLDYPIFNPKFEEEGEYKTEDERPQGWSIEREWEDEQSRRVAEILMRYTEEMGDKAKKLPGDWLVQDLPEAVVTKYMQEFGPMNEVRKKGWTNQQLQTKRIDDFCFRIQPRHLRFAGIIMALLQAAKELSSVADERQREALRDELLFLRGTDEKSKDARRVLNEIDLFWPTHLSFTYRDSDSASELQHQELLCLVALADEVVTQPLGRQRAVLSLGPSGQVNLTEKLSDAFPLGVLSPAIEAIADRVDNSKTGAEAVLRVFSADKNIDTMPMDVFTRLRDWEHTGLLEDITLTVKRLHPTESFDGLPDDIIVTYDQLSDGEQMLLGRMGLLFLLRGQDGSLLLLDEPETHFNDVWKREIVEMVDMSLLNSTDANVIVSTHTSIALTDAFAAEVTVMDKNRTSGVTTARSVKGGLFGTDPGEVNMNLFGASSSIGSRSVEILDKLLKTEWKDREGELEAILNVLGSSFHRAELRAILRKLQMESNGTASN